MSCSDAATNPTCVRSASDTDDVVEPLINVAKSAVGVSGPNALGVYTVSYTITVTNSGGAAGTYGALTDTPVFPANTNITGIAWTTSGAGAPAGGSSTIDGPNQLTGTGIAIGAGVTHTFDVSITYVYTDASAPTTCAATPTPGSGLYNNASLPTGQETDTSDNATCVNPPAVPAASLTIDKTAGTPSGSTAGSTIAYTFVITNTGAVTLNGIAVVDAQLDAPATCGSTTLTPSAPGNTTTCTGVHTITAAEVAAGSVSNSATATGSTSGGIAVTSPPDTTLTTLVPSVNFCAVDSVFNVTQVSGRGEFYRYTVGSGTPDVLVPELTLNVAPNLNAMMVDPVNNRLLFISYSGGQSTLYAYDAANGGWYAAAGPIATPDFPRAGMTQAGVGYLVAGSGANPAVWRVTPSGAFNYSLASYGNLTYDFQPTNASSGDIAFDGAGYGWLTAGVDLYRIDFSTAAVSATRQQRPLLNGAPSTLQWAGVAYGNDGLLYVATNTAPSSYYRIDLSTGTLAPVAATAANQARDLASCSFPAAPTPAQLQVEKTLAQVNGSAYVAGAAVAAGDTLTYQIEVTHVGGSLAATLFAGDVVETLPANTTAVAAGNNFTCAASNCTNTNAVNIPVGGSATLNFVVQVVAPFPTGATASIVNTVAVDGVSCAAVGNDCGETTPVALPELAIAKTAGAATTALGASPTLTDAGDTIAYSFLVSNTGNTPLTAVAVIDAQLDAAATCPSTTLAVGANMTCTGTHTITQVEVNAGAVNNSATATGTPPSGPPVTSPPSTTTTPITTTSALTIAKTAGTATTALGASPTLTDAGDTIAYSFLVSNTGNTPLTAVAVIDAQLDAAATCPSTTLAVGANMTCTGTHTITQVEVNAGAVNNSATATGTPPSGPPVTSPPSTTTTPITTTSALTIAKTAGTATTALGASPTLTDAGDTIAYSFLVTNTGNVTLTGITVTDAMLDASAVCDVTTLLPGAIANCTGTHTITQAEVNAGTVNNSATATGTPPVGPPVTSPPSTTTTPITTTSTLTIAKTAGTPTTALGTSSTLTDAGDTIAYSFLVSNTGNTPLTAVLVNDAQLDAAATCPSTTLAVGANMTCTGTHTITQAEVNAGAVNNSATVTGTPPSGPPVTSPPSTTTTPITTAPALTLVKTAGTLSGNTAGSTLGYTFVVNNTGNVTLSGIVINDAQLDAPAVCDVTTLLPGAIATCTGTHTVTQAEVNAGTVNNSATATGTPPSGPPVASPPSTTTTPITTAPALTIVKTAGPPSGNTAGSTIGYTFVVTNTGNVTLTGIVVTDAMLDAPAVCDVTTLLPSAIATCTGSHTITQAEVNNGAVNNSATATGTPPSGPPVTSPPSTTTTPIASNPALTIAKTAGAPSGNTAGSTIGYTFVVTNTGNVTLSGIVIDDALLDAPAVCDATTLLPLAIATCTGTHTITQAEVNAGAVNNSATATGTPPVGPPVTSPPSTTTTPIASNPALTIAKTAGTPSGNTAGSTIGYTFVVTNTGNVTLSGIVINDAQLDAPAVCDVTTLLPSAIATCTGTHTITQAEVNAGAANNSATVTGTPPVGPPVTSPPSTTTTPIAANPALSLLKTAGAPSGNIAGSTIGYTFVATNTGNVTLTGIVIDDALLDAPAVCDATTLLPGAIATCTGIHTITQAEVAAGVVNNTATATGTPPVGPAVPSNSSTTSTPLLAVTVSKISNPASGETVRPGDTISYTLAVVVANAATTSTLTLTDTLSGDQTLTGPLPANCASGAGGLVCTLAAGTQPGSYSFTYSTTVDADATGRLGNNVVPSGTDNPTCTNCSTEHPVAASVVTVAKTSNPASGAEVAPGDTVTYTVTVTVANSITTDAVTLTDTISGDQVLTGALPAGCAASGGGLVCTLAAGALPGSYSFSYSTRVAADATGTLGNVVVPSGGDGPTCVDCSTSHTVVATAITVSKTSNPASGTSVSAGDTLAYTLAVTVANSVTTDAVTLTDTISGDQTLTGTLPAGCAASATGLVCTVAAGTLPGTYTFAYTTLVDTDATGTVGNVVVPTGADSPTCALACSTEHPVLSDYQLRILKTVAVREVKIGDLVRYTLSVENVGNGRLINGSIVDTPPLGFSYVEGSLSVTDGDNQATAVGQSPLRFEGLDIEPGQTATLMYAMRVGAGVRPGVQRNLAQAFTQSGAPISNSSTAAVTLVADALVDDSLLIGTVFDDRDGDTWQDSAALSGVRVQGGFASGAYVANSTTVDRGMGAQPEADASSPLLHGIDVGAIGARQSIADPVEHHQVVIRQRLNQPAFTNDFVLTSAQGVTVRMDAAGKTTVEKSGEAAKGLNAAEPKVERRIAQGEGGYVVDYVISNLGIDERGVPGVRIASVEGLLIETDQFGRYHLEGIAGGDSGRGRNFILKVDPSTLPAGTAFTTDNPLVRRITPGLPVRFDFGVKLPVEEVQGGEQQVELELGEVIFAPGSAKLRDQYLPVIEQIAAKVAEYRGGEVLVSANGDTESLAFDRASAVKDALVSYVPADIAKALTVSVRTELDDPSSLLVGIAEGGPLLGTVLFDTDKSTVKPQFLPLLDKVAAYLDEKGGGAIAIVGHADPRGSDAYNAALGMRRAKAVYEAVAAKLSPAVRAKVRVESSNDPAAPAGTGK
ncbi:hypothetical protein CSC73_00760 [Pseudoxanthomonas sacheonensis]|nr:hypothetical protein CSC73_00760 [Pseudoxanthomonas sacheonensis]